MLGKAKYYKVVGMMEMLSESSPPTCSQALPLGLKQMGNILSITGHIQHRKLSASAPGSDPSLGLLG